MATEEVTEEDVKKILESFEEKTEEEPLEKEDFESIMVQIGLLDDEDMLQENVKYSSDTLGIISSKGKTCNWLGHSFREKNPNKHPLRFNHNMCKCGERFQMIFELETQKLGKDAECEIVKFLRVNFEIKERKQRENRPKLKFEPILLGEIREETLQGDEPVEETFDNFVDHEEKPDDDGSTILDRNFE